MKTVTANGLRFAYFEEGTGPLVLLLHGFPDTAYTWNLIQPAVAAAGYRVVAPFTRGYAPTEIPTVEAYDGDTLGRDVLALISALGEKRAIVVGHDWGAGAAYSAAFIGPEQVELLVTVAIPHPGSIFPTPIKLWKGRHFFTLYPRSAVERTRRNNFADVDMFVQRWSPKWKVPPNETEKVKAAFSEPGCLEAALVAARKNKSADGDVRRGRGSAQPGRVRLGRVLVHRRLPGGTDARRPLHAPRISGALHSRAARGSRGPPALEQLLNKSLPSRNASPGIVRPQGHER